MTLTDRQHLILDAIQRGLNGISSTDTVAHRMGYRPAARGRLAVRSTIRKLEEKGLVGRLPPRDQWGHTDWFVTEEGRRVWQAER